MDAEIQQPDMRNKQKKQNQNVYMALIFLFVTAFCMVAISQENRYREMHTQKLILTREGCNYISSLGLVPKHETSGCSIIARYSSGFLGSDRVILLDDDRFVTLSSAAVLGNADTDVKLPDTPDQRRASFITDAVFAALIMMLIFVFYDIFKPGKSEKKGSESCPRK